MATGWHSHEAFFEDLFSYSDQQHTCEDEDDPVQPVSIQEYNKRIGANNTPSIFEHSFPIDDAPFYGSGRGRGIRSALIVPGEVPRPDVDVIRRLRQVSGLGYSNELIEESFKAATQKPSTVTIPEIKLQPLESANSTISNRTTPSRTSKIDSPGSSKVSSVCVTPSKSTASSSLSMSSCSSRSSSPPCLEEAAAPAEVVEKASCSNPLPLSVMRDRARKDVKKVKENLKKETEKIEVSIVKENGESSQLDLSSNSNLNAEAPEWLPNGDDFWWNRTSNSETTNAEGTNSWRRRSTNSPGATNGVETNSWRRRGPNSPNRYFNWNLNHDKKKFDIGSSKDFPALK